MADPYNTRAHEYAAHYVALAPEEVHASWLRYLPDTKGRVLDVGTGSGRDAAWLANLGHEVTAVEPAQNMLDWAMARYDPQGSRIDWRRDRLPDLATFDDEQGEYSLILVSAVWMHIHERHRGRALRKLTNLLRPGGRIVITLRHGVSPDERVMHQVSSAELLALARHSALDVLHTDRSGDAMGRSRVSWETIVLGLPDDGTGALPLLRHIIVNDTKSSTYKVVLLKVLLHIANSSTGAARVEGERALIPFGLVALYWVKLLYRPLLERGMQQLPTAKELKNQQYFRELIKQDVRFEELEIGQRFTDERAAALFQALREARNLIHKMPAHYITFPGMHAEDQGEPQVFLTQKLALRCPREVRLNESFFYSFGTLSIPLHIWSAMTRYASWIEPAIDHEWITLMQGFDKRPAKEKPTLLEYRQAITWQQHERAQQRAYAYLRKVHERNQLFCTWSGKKITNLKSVAVDHVFPFAHWPNNDLWNLVPSSSAVNGRKSDKLITAQMLYDASDRILSWYEAAFRDEALTSPHPIFFEEANTSLPKKTIPHYTDFEQVIKGMNLQRLHLKLYQQLPEWQLS